LTGRHDIICEDTKKLFILRHGGGGCQEQEKMSLKKSRGLKLSHSGGWNRKISKGG